MVSEIGTELPLAAGTAHLTHLLSCSAAIADDMLPAATGGVLGLLSQLLLDTAWKLSALPAGWELARPYLRGMTAGSASATVEHSSALKAVVSRAALSSEKECTALVAWCRREGLHDEADAMCRSLSLMYTIGSYYCIHTICCGVSTVILTVIYVLSIHIVDTCFLYVDQSMQHDLLFVRLCNRAATVCIDSSVMVQQ
jgi:hypothetical protein